MRKLASFLAAIAILFFTPLATFGAESDLGISLQVLKGGEGSSENINKNNNLWFVIEPGKSSSRQVRIYSASNITQKIHFSIAGRTQINGELKYDPNAKSIVNDWAKYSSNDFLLKPGQTKQVTIAIDVPSDATREVLQPALLVKAIAATKTPSKYKIPTAMQISQGIFLGVGTVDEFKTSFSIDDVFGQNGVSGHSLQVKITNTGKTPIALEGELQLSSSTFIGSTIGPLSFYTATIYPGESGYGEILVGPEVPEDKYRIQVRATQGFITETRNFEKDIDFRGLAQLYSLLFWVVIIIASLLVALFSIRYLRKANIGSRIITAQESSSMVHNKLVKSSNEIREPKQKPENLKFVKRNTIRNMTIARFKKLKQMISGMNAFRIDYDNKVAKKASLIKRQETSGHEYLQTKNSKNVYDENSNKEPKIVEYKSALNFENPKKAADRHEKFTASNINRDASTQEIIDEIMSKWGL